MEQTVDVIIKETITEHISVDQILVERVRQLVLDALDEVEGILKFGLMDQKIQIIKMLLGASTRNLGKDFTSHEQEAKIALESLFEQMRDVGPETTPKAIDHTDEGADN